MSGKGTHRLGPNVAGTWYPREPLALAQEVDGLLAAAERDEEREAGLRESPLAMIAPHAGYAYSGRVAALGFRHVRGARISRVVLIGPSHYAAFSGAVVPAAQAYRTPLGEVPLDVDAIAALGEWGFAVRDAPFDREHSLEAELPFLQRCLVPGWRLLPLLMGSGSTRSSFASVAGLLRAWLDATTLVVVSSDFTHYGPRFGYVPFQDDVPAGIRRLDLGAVERIAARDFEGFESHLERTGATICGRDAISVLLRLLPAEVTGKVAGYDTSGRMTGDFRHSVSYASLVFHRPGRPCPS
jgi:hypothetical protein